MSYVAPYIDAAGLHLNTYTDIETALTDSAKSIFGQDIYLDNDSQDMQWISTVARMIYDAEQMCALAYNNESPQTAIGVSLDNLVQLNGIARNPATYSTVSVALQGNPGMVIAAGVVYDDNGYLWDLPPNTQIGDDGVVTVTAICETAGAITADVGTIQGISTIQYGWNAVYNPAAATPGTPVETDTALQTRQSDSVALPSQTVLDGILAAVGSVDGVTQVAGYENDTPNADSNGIPANSTAIIAVGGDNTAIAEQIAYHKTLGSPTYGTTAVPITSDALAVLTINFSRPAAATISVAMTVIPLAGYTSTVQDTAITDVQNYINALQIATSVYASSLIAAALSASNKAPSFSISALTVSKNGGTPGASASIAWNEIAQAGTVTVTGGY